MKKLYLVLMIVALALVAAQCGAAPEAPAPAVQEEATEIPASDSADATTEDDAATEENATESESTEEAAEADKEAEDQEIVEESQASKAQDVKGISVTSDEEVASPRNNFGGEYRDVASSDAVSFHLYNTTDTGSSGYQAMVYSGGLLRLDENTLEYIPNMAQSYTISEDGLTFIFKLRQDMKWSDGEPITANDFKWTFDQFTKPENEFPYLSQVEFITSYEALDDYTLEVKIDEVYAPALSQIASMVDPLPKHIWENLDWNDPETNPEIMSPTVVSGPYKLVEWERDQYAIFEANENYWYHGRPNFDRYIIEIVPDNDIGYQRMKNSESDTGPITPENLEEARQLENLTVYEWWPAAARWSYMGLNMREGFPTEDIKVRHAINYAIDKELVTEEVMLGQAKRLCSTLPETSWAFNPDVECYPYNPDTAIELFAEAGYTLQDEAMVDENGDPLKLKLIYGPNTSETLELTSLAIQDYLSEVGVEVEIQSMEWASFLEATNAAEPDWDMYLGAWRSPIEPHIMWTLWHEDFIPQLNKVHYINKDVEALFEEAGKTYDTEFRKEKYYEVQEILADEAPYVFLFYNKIWSGQNNRIQGLEPTPLGIGWNSEDWYIAEESQ